MLDTLTQEGDNDYKLNTGVFDGVWITVNNISVHIIKTDEGVVVDLYPAKKENDNPIASTYAHFTEAESEV